MKSLTLEGFNLTIENIYDVAIAGEKEYVITLSAEAKNKVLKASQYVSEITKKDKAVYGINTGFGALSQKKIPNEELTQLQVNLIRSHCTGVGEPFSAKVVRAIMLLRANCLVSGHSGITLTCLQQIFDFLHHNIIPVIPQKGSVGASGDLAPLAHMALALIGEGEVFYHNIQMPTADALTLAGLKALQLQPKEGLALINGTAVMAALGSLAVYEAKQLVKLADLACAMTLEGVRGSSTAYHPYISQCKPHPGQLVVAKNLLKLLTPQSEISLSHNDCGKVQDPYSLRCVPQVHGAIRQCVRHAEEVVNIEINSVTDNPLIFVDDKLILSGGNFHGEAIALVMDYLSMGLSELANIAERRVEKMVNPVFSDLPAFLTKNSGLNSGLMIAQVTMAALASENKYLCHPASIDSIPTSTDKEDHVSMGVTSGRKLLEIIDNVIDCMSIEFLCNTQALYLLSPLKTNPQLQVIYDLIRTKVPPIGDDRVFSEDMKAIRTLIVNGDILRAIESQIPLE